MVLYDWQKVHLKGLFLSLGVSTVETNRDRDQDFSICRAQLLKPVKIVLSVATRLFFIWVVKFKIKIF
jgi:hypothetical protein